MGGWGDKDFYCISPHTPDTSMNAYIRQSAAPETPPSHHRLYNPNAHRHRMIFEITQICIARMWLR